MLTTPRGADGGLGLRPRGRLRCAPARGAVAALRALAPARPLRPPAEGRAYDARGRSWRSTGRCFTASKRCLHCSASTMMPRANLFPRRVRRLGDPLVRGEALCSEVDRSVNLRQAVNCSAPPSRPSLRTVRARARQDARGAHVPAQALVRRRRAPLRLALRRRRGAHRELAHLLRRRVRPARRTARQVRWRRWVGFAAEDWLSSFARCTSESLPGDAQALPGAYEC